MSGATGIPAGTQMGVTNGGQPKSSRVYSFSVTLTAGVGYNIDLRSLQNLNVLHDVQGIYFDNSANATALLCQCATGQNITCPPNSQGVAPAYVSPNNPVFTFFGNGTVTITLLNFQSPAAFWSAIGNTIPVIGGKVQVSDPILENLIQNNAFNSANALFGPNDTIIRGRSGAAYYNAIAANGTTTAINGAPNSFVTGYNFSCYDASGNPGTAIVTLGFLNSGTILHAQLSVINTLSLTGLNLLGSLTGDNVTVNVAALSAGATLYSTIFGGPTAIV